MEEFSDAGSIPASSIAKKPQKHMFLRAFSLRNKYGLLHYSFQVIIALRL